MNHRHRTLAPPSASTVRAPSSLRPAAVRSPRLHLELPSTARPAAAARSPPPPPPPSAPDTSARSYGWGGASLPFARRPHRLARRHRCRLCLADRGGRLTPLSRARPLLG
ncbi:hypothetical protein PVAP13_8NG354155 [Panicum virgatum]|uniref:Uncharacterized protein n=1 Tax=Panicum virgatum TaxID=38727 RepID=A0A8T0P1H8_PANVG|nr:hypothetical protein PVAP13_8NG354155 [Panicum virgatum]